MMVVIFLAMLGLIWIAAATIQDLKKREVANWISFSLIAFALGFRFFYSLFSDKGFAFLYEGLIGLGIFFVLGNLFYYGRLFAGGDAKLFISLGPIISFSESSFINLKIFAVFLLIFLISGAFYGLVWSVALALKHKKEFKKEFYKISLKNKNLFLLIMAFGLVIMFAGFFQAILFFLGAVIFIFPYFYLYAKAVDESCMIKKIKVSELIEGDWLYKDLIVGREKIKADWEGLTKDEIRKLRRRYKQVLIRQGIPFVPVFLIAFLVLIIGYFGGFGFL
ncbi:MAG: prepilin peptidase [Nanoarchaeota archaeon]|nr:prepilin peptidase [Nanoarchaeota archaeon]